MPSVTSFGAGYAQGYRDCLDDLAAAYARGGEVEARAWLHRHTSSTTTTSSTDQQETAR
jgi:hypothetical protein